MACYAAVVTSLSDTLAVQDWPQSSPAGPLGKQEAIHAGHSNRIEYKYTGQHTAHGIISIHTVQHNGRDNATATPPRPESPAGQHQQEWREREGVARLHVDCV